jgi:hypothetical protein
MGCSTFIFIGTVLVLEASALSRDENCGWDLKALANSEYPGGYCENPYGRFDNVNLIRGG